MNEQTPETVLYVRPTYSGYVGRWEKIAKHDLSLVTLSKDSAGFDFATRIEMQFHKSLLVEQQYNIVKSYIIGEKILTMAEAKQAKKLVSKRETQEDCMLDANLHFTILTAQKLGEIIYYKGKSVFSPYDTMGKNQTLINASEVSWV